MRALLIVAVAVGGAIGAVLRFSLTEWVPTAGGTFPWTTFAINVSGCFLLALLPAFAAVRRNPLLPPLLGTGLLGGYTTLSTYSEETRALIDTGRTVLALVYLLGTLVTAVVGVAIADHFSSLVQRAEFEAEEGDL